MIAKLAVLSLVLLAPQGSSQEQPRTRRTPQAMQASSSVPLGDTLLALEFAPVDKLLREARELPLLAVLREPKVAGLLDRFSSDDDLWWWAQRARFEKLLGRCDRGTCLASVFFDAGYNSPQPYVFYVGASRSSASLRGFEDDFASIVQTECERRGLPLLERQESSVPGSPLPMTVLAKGGDDQERRSRRMALFARRGRRVAMFGGRYWGTREIAEKRNAGAARIVGELVGSGRANGVMSLGGGEAPDCLMRGVLRFDEHIHGPNMKFTEDRAGRAHTEMRQAGMFRWTGLEARLQKVEGKLRETWDSYDKAVEGDTFFRAIRGDAFGLHDAAEYLPETALAAMRVAVDDAMFSRWLSSTCEMARSSREYEQVVAALRPILGLDSATGADGFKGITEATFAVLPPAPGVLAPEMCLMFRVDAETGTPKNALESVVKMMHGWGGEQPEPEIKTLGRGDDAITYIDLKKLMPSRRGFSPRTEELMVLKAAFGGGFLSSARVGPYLVLGCNPRTMRKLVRSVAAGKTLAAREGFAARFPKGSGRFLEGWFDWRAIVERASVIDTVLPLVLVGAPSRRARVARVVVEAPAPVPAPAQGGDPVAQPAKKEEPAEAPAPQKVQLPRARDLAAMLGEQFVLGTKEDFGNRIVFEGSLVLSPISICGAMSAFYFLDQGPGTLVSRW